MTNPSTPLQLAHDLTLAWLNNPHTRAGADDVVTFMATMKNAVATLKEPPVEEGAAEPVVASYERPVSIRKSLADANFIISMIDGKPYKTLKRHLAVNGLTPARYRQRYGLPATYPMIAPNYSAARSETAKRIGLGRKAKEVVAAVVESKSVKKARKSISEAKAAAKAHLGQQT